MVLPPFIIDEIRKREEERRRRQEDADRPAIRLPIPGSDPLDHPPEPPTDPDEDDDRGVVIIDL